jgi:hypothetical protein
MIVTIFFLLMIYYLIYPDRIFTGIINVIKWFQKNNKLTDRYFRIHKRKIWK